MRWENNDGVKKKNETYHTRYVETSTHTQHRKHTTPINRVDGREQYWLVP